jgi:hypothetical protein
LAGRLHPLSCAAPVLGRRCRCLCQVHASAAQPRARGAVLAVERGSVAGLAQPLWTQVKLQFAEICHIGMWPLNLSDVAVLRSFVTLKCWAEVGVWQRRLTRLGGSDACSHGMSACSGHEMEARQQLFDGRLSFKYHTPVVTGRPPDMCCIHIMRPSDIAPAGPADHAAA